MSSRTYQETIEYLESRVFDLEADAARWQYVRDHLAVIGPTCKWWEFDFAYGVGSLTEVVDRLIVKQEGPACRIPGTPAHGCVFTQSKQHVSKTDT